jgi:Tol biopolymer transport system component
VNSAESDQDPFVAPDGSYLITCLTGRDDSRGGYDLYVSFASEDGAWSEPVNLGDGVNTSGPEFRPYVTQDGRYLFFTGLDPDNDAVGRIFWAGTEVIEVAKPR